MPNTGLIARIDTGVPGKCVAFRADIDALKIEEDCSDGRTYGSVNKGVMHACGHDIHMTVALGLLSYFSENQPQDNLLFFFQPGSIEVAG